MERIDVRASKLTINLVGAFGSVTGYHLYIAYIDTKGKEYIFEGFPIDKTTGKLPLISASTLLLNPPGLLTQGRCTSSSWGKIYQSTSNVASVTVVVGIDAIKKYSCLREHTAIFNAENIPYRMTMGPNSNSYVRTMLERCGIPVVKPPSAVFTPGWELSIKLN
jgi:hypothetical protein